MNLTLPVDNMYNWHYPTSGVIIVIDTIQRAFQNAHLAVLKKKGTPPKKLYMSVMKQWWWEEYGITILDDWFALEFASEQALTMFLLRWS